MLIKFILEGISLSAFIVLAQLYILPSLGLFSPSVDTVAGMAFTGFLVYVAMSILYRSDKHEENT